MACVGSFGDNCPRFDHTDRMPFEAHIKELCERLGQCQDDAQSLKFAQELQILLRERIQQLREKVEAFPLIAPSKEQK